MYLFATRRLAPRSAHGLTAGVAVGTVASAPRSHTAALRRSTDARRRVHVQSKMPTVLSLARGNTRWLTRIANPSTDGMKKSDLEVALDDFLAENSNQFSNNPATLPYYQARARAIGSPVKKEAPPAEAPKTARRRAAKAAEQNIAAPAG
jgi:hypothetical protein